MAKLNRTCGICKTKYSYCPTCAADAHKPTWMAVFCSENCKDLYDVINDYKYEKLNKEKAHQRLNDLDLSSTSKLPENFKLIVDEILTKEKQIEMNMSENIEEKISDNISSEVNALDEIVEPTQVVTNEKSTEELMDSAIQYLSDESIIEVKKPRTKRKAKIVE